MHTAQFWCVPRLLPREQANDQLNVEVIESGERSDQESSEDLLADLRRLHDLVTQSAVVPRLDSIFDLPTGEGVPSGEVWY